MAMLGMYALGDSNYFAALQMTAKMLMSIVWGYK